MPVALGLTFPRYEPPRSYVILTDYVDQHPVPTSVVTTDHEIPRKRTQQVTGSIIPRNISSADLLPSPDHSDSAEHYGLFHHRL